VGKLTKTIEIQRILQQKKYFLKNLDFFANYISDFFGLIYGELCLPGSYALLLVRGRDFRNPLKE
jgi:hypothetical protein